MLYLRERRGSSFTAILRKYPRTDDIPCKCAAILYKTRFLKTIPKKVAIQQRASGTANIFFKTLPPLHHYHSAAKTGLSGGGLGGAGRGVLLFYM
jgi:hypothetical protein